MNGALYGRPKGGLRGCPPDHSLVTGVRGLVDWRGMWGGGGSHCYKLCTVKRKLCIWKLDLFTMALKLHDSQLLPNAIFVHTVRWEIFIDAWDLSNYVCQLNSSPLSHCTIIRSKPSYQWCALLCTVSRMDMGCSWNTPSEHTAMFNW